MIFSIRSVSPLPTGIQTLVVLVSSLENVRFSFAQDETRGVIEAAAAATTLTPGEPGSVAQS